MASELRKSGADEHNYQFSILNSQFLKPWLLPAVYERHAAGLGDFLTELRPAVPLFLRFEGIDFVDDGAAGAKLDALIRLVQQIVTRSDGAVLQLTIGDKGSYLYVVFGAPTAHEDDARRAVVAALELRAATAQLADVESIQICNFGWALQCLGDYSAARAYYEQCLSMIDAGGYHQYDYRVLVGLGTLLRNQGHHVEARSAFTRAVEGAQASHDQWQEGIGHWGLGNVALDLGELDAAASAFTESLAALRNAGNPIRAIEAISGLVAVALARGDIAQAKAHVETILDYLAHSPLTTVNTEEPLRIELICYQTLRALDDPRAPNVLESAHERLQKQAARILDSALRRSFLQNVPHHRELVAAWEAYHAS